MLVRRARFARHSVVPGPHTDKVRLGIATNCLEECRWKDLP
nr:MAG TPA: hypothetical protein [Caudoviricetes sp.]